MNGHGIVGTGGHVVKKPERPPDDEEQSRRFVETARKIRADESGKVFARAFKKIITKKARKRKS